VIKNELELMKLQKSDLELEPRLKRLGRAVDRMSRQIDVVMDFVREKPLKIEQFSSAKLIESVLRNTTIPEKIEIIHPESDITLTGDFTQLETVLSNILTNSIQAIGTTGKIWMKVEPEQGQVTISVMDSGPGIPEDALLKIFEPLFTTKQQGTGLGLSSCNTIIENHGGTITVSNNPTTFAISLPQTNLVSSVQIPLSN
jgi:signal transduction histidine kinase